MPDLEKFYNKLKKDTENGGYHLNPDKEFVLDLIYGLLTNEERYGYQSCPCRLADGTKEKDLDIICPCDYRDPDLAECGACYCALYVTLDWIEGKVPRKSIPERREREEHEDRISATPAGSGVSSIKLPIWRCRVCGYLCARDGPPEVCPICKAKKDRFEIFISTG